MKKLFNFKRAKKTTVNVGNDRARMARAMPGEVGAMASFRLTGIAV